MKAPFYYPLWARWNEHSSHIFYKQPHGTCCITLMKSSNIHLCSRKSLPDVWSLRMLYGIRCIAVSRERNFWRSLRPHIPGGSHRPSFSCSTCSCDTKDNIVSPLFLFSVLPCSLYYVRHGIPHIRPLPAKNYGQGFSWAVNPDGTSCRVWMPPHWNPSCFWTFWTDADSLKNSYGIQYR